MPRPALGVAAPLALVIGLLSAPAARAQPAAPPAAPATAVDTGQINGAAYRIEIPAEWNTGLVMYAHGYERVGQKPGDPDAPQRAAMRHIFLSRGFAFAESAYSAQGWAVKEGIEDTEALRRYFVARHGKPGETYITGHSMGGHITIATIERYPDAYQGALPLCGPLGPTIDFFDNGLFDMLVVFEALFPGTIGDPYTPGGPATAARRRRPRSPPIPNAPLSTPRGSRDSWSRSPVSWPSFTASPAS